MPRPRATSSSRLPGIEIAGSFVKAPVKKRTNRIAILVLLLVAVAAGWKGLGVYRRIRPASLADWADDVAWPGFKLRYRTRTATHYVAVFEAPADRLAFCRMRLAGAPSGPEPTPAITDVAGHDLVDPDRPHEALFRVWDLGPVRHVFDDGELIPIRPGFQGRMRIVFDTEGSPAGGDSDASIRVLDTHLRWGDEPAPR